MRSSLSHKEFRWPGLIFQHRVKLVRLELVVLVVFGGPGHFLANEGVRFWLGGVTRAHNTHKRCWQVSGTNGTEVFWRPRCHCGECLGWHAAVNVPLSTCSGSQWYLPCTNFKPYNYLNGHIGVCSVAPGFALTAKKELWPQLSSWSMKGQTFGRSQ